MKRTRYIAYFLMVIFSLILVHNMVPHHHHGEQVVFHTVDHCGEKDHDGHNSEHEPINCLMLCHLSFYAGEAFTNVRPLVVISPDYFIHSNNVILLADEPVEFVFILQKPPERIPGYFEAQFLRGPPELFSV